MKANTELQTKILETLNQWFLDSHGPILLSALAAALGVEARLVGNALDSMRRRHQVKHQTNKGWTITGVGRRVLTGYAPAPKKVKTQPKLTQAPAPAAPPVAPAPKRVTHVALVVDRSGSMSSCQEAAQEAVNKLQTQLAEKSKTEPTTLTLVRFDDRVELVYQGLDPAKLPPFYLEPRDRTALLQATLSAVESLKQLPKDGCDPAYLVTVITDGEENCSSWAAKEQLPKEILALQATDRWTFTFLVPNSRGEANLRAFGVPAGNIAIWEATETGAQQMSSVMSSAMDSYFVGRSRGVTRSNSFFQPDLSKLTATDLAKLTDIRGRCYLWSIDQEAVIQPFVEAKLGHYQPGMGYYPLTKRETVQAFKQIALVDRKTGAIFAGIEARQLLGLPTTEVKVEPGNHAGFDIYIQSTSNNRKLVRGSKLLYMK